MGREVVITHFSGVSPWRIDVLLNAYLRTGSERSVTIEHFPHNEAQGMFDHSPHSQGKGGREGPNVDTVNRH